MRPRNLQPLHNQQHDARQDKGRDQGGRPPGQNPQPGHQQDKRRQGCSVPCHRVAVIREQCDEAQPQGIACSHGQRHEDQAQQVKGQILQLGVVLKGRRGDNVLE
jgi:hypothetical protein